MRVLDLAFKDIVQLIRDWKAAAFLVIMPIGFTLLMGFFFGGGGGGEEDFRLPVAFLDQDGSSVVSDSLMDLLSDSNVIRLVIVEDEDQEALMDQVVEEAFAAAVIVPNGYGEKILNGDLDQLIVIADDASPIGHSARNDIQAAVVRLLTAGETARITTEAIEAQGGNADDALFEAALAQAIAAWEEPALTITTTHSGVSIEEESNLWSGYAQYSPGMMVQFAVAGLISSAEVLVLERKSRALQRLLTTALSRVEIILGHFLTMFLMVFVQLLLLASFGQIVLGLDYWREPLALLLVMVSMTLWTASLGLLIGVLAKTPEHVVSFSMILMFVLSGLGGAWMSLESTSETFKTIGHLMPSAWAMDGFQNLLIRGLGLESVLLPSGIMLAYAVVFFGLAVWRFRFE